MLYLEAFATFVNENKDTIEAICIACTKPSDMTRAQLKELKLALDKQNFTESNFNQAKGFAAPASQLIMLGRILWSRW